MSFKLKTGDFVVTAVVLAAAAAVFLIMIFRTSSGEDGRLYAEINCGGKISVYPLWKDDAFTVQNNGYTLEIEISDGEVRVKNSDCPDRICVMTGKINGVGQSVACVPAGVLIKITGDVTGEEADWIAG